MAIPATVREYLEQAGVDYKVVEHPYTETSMRSAEAAHVTGEDVAKGVLLKDGDGYVLAVVPATHNVQVGEVQSQLDRALEPAPEDDLAIVFADCAVGAVPALGPAYQLETITDVALRGHDEIYFEAGDHKELIQLSGDDFESLLAPSRFMSISAHRP